MVLSMRAHTVVASAERPRPRRVQAPQRSTIDKSLKLGTGKLRHQAPRGPLMAPVRYTSVPERQGEGQADELDTRKVHQMADAQEGGQVTAQPQQVDKEATGRPNEMADAQPASHVTPPEQPGKQAASVDEERMPGYHHESREELARKGAAVHEEIFPHREGSA